jgi:hypothetical protein
MAPRKFDHFWQKVRLLAQPFPRCDGGILKIQILKPQSGGEAKGEQVQSGQSPRQLRGQGRSS